jgi:CHASE2 domain-containing sensor protein
MENIDLQMVAIVLVVMVVLSIVIGYVTRQIRCLFRLILFCIVVLVLLGVAGWISTNGGGF